MELPRIDYTSLIPSVAAKVAEVIGRDDSNFIPIVHTIAARTACSCEHGGRPTTELEDILNVERAMMLNPTDVLSRHFRTVVLGAKGGSDDDGILTFHPQLPCIPLRMVVPAEDVDKYFSNMQAGLEQYFASNDRINGRMFSIESVATFIRPLYTRIGQDVTVKMNTTSEGHGHVLICADMSADGRLASGGQLRPMGFTVDTLAAGGDQTTTLRPQKNFRIRKLSLRGADVDTLHEVTLTAFKVGVEPQFLSADEVTAELFDASVPWETWLDGDMACIGQEITLNWHNYGDAPVSFEGVLEGDVIAG